VGNRSKRPSANRYSRRMLCPSTYPHSVTQCDFASSHQDRRSPPRMKCGRTSEGPDPPGGAPCARLPPGASTRDSRPLRQGVRRRSMAPPFPPGWRTRYLTPPDVSPSPSQWRGGCHGKLSVTPRSIALRQRR
jgi:hypothetical protein